MELPQKITRKENCIVEYRGWGEVEPELFGTFLDKEKVLIEELVISGERYCKSLGGYGQFEGKPQWKSQTDVLPFSFPKS